MIQLMISELHVAALVSAAAMSCLEQIIPLSLQHTHIHIQMLNIVK